MTSQSTTKTTDDGDESSVDEDDEELDPRIKLELEKLNAATDGINHLETEFGEAQALFNQMMQDASLQLKFMHQKLGKCVDKSRPYFDALVQAKIGHTQLHSAALTFEKAQTRHYNAKIRVRDAEAKVMGSVERKLDPALQEILNQSTMEVMEASKLSEEAWEKHREASLQFEDKQKIVSDLYHSLKKNVHKARPYFDLKMNLNKQLEMQKKRLEKIQEGLQVSKSEYAKTLHNLEVISDDIHKVRELKKRALLEPRGRGVGADSDDNDDKMVHAESMERIRAATLDNISDTRSITDNNSDTASITDNISDTKSIADSENSEFSRVDDEIPRDLKEMRNLHIPVATTRSCGYIPKLKLDIDTAVKQSALEGYDVIMSHSIVESPPPPTDFFSDVMDGMPMIRARSFGDVRHLRAIIEKNSTSGRRKSSSLTDADKGSVKNLLVRIASLRNLQSHNNR